MYDGVVGKTEKQSGTCVMVRGRTGDMVAATDEKEAEIDDMSWPSRVGGMVYNSLEFMQMQPQPPKATASPWLWATTES